MALVATWAFLLVVWALLDLVRPWFRDVSASLALGWDRGVVRYRDLVAYDLAGRIDLRWALGERFGWGRTVPLDAVELVMFVGPGVSVVGWSRRRVGGPLRGLAAVAAVRTESLT